MLHKISSTENDIEFKGDGDTIVVTVLGEAPNSLQRKLRNWISNEE